jgi:hypothetical protein
MGSHLELCWSYVGGSEGLIDAILQSDDFEALSAEPGDPTSVIEPWLEDVVSNASDELIRTGSTEVVTPKGSVRAVLDFQGDSRLGEFRLVSSHQGGDESIRCVQGHLSEDNLVMTARMNLSTSLISLMSS